MSTLIHFPWAEYFSSPRLFQQLWLISAYAQHVFPRTPHLHGHHGGSQNVHSLTSALETCREWALSKGSLWEKPVMLACPELASALKAQYATCAPGQV